MQVIVWACRQTLTWVLCQMPQINLVPPHHFIENPPKKTHLPVFLKKICTILSLQNAAVLLI